MYIANDIVAGAKEEPADKKTQWKQKKGSNPTEIETNLVIETAPIRIRGHLQISYCLCIDRVQ